MKTRLFTIAFLSAILTACGGGGGGGGTNPGDGGKPPPPSSSKEKLLVKIEMTDTLYPGETTIRTFDYDDQNRLIFDSKCGTFNYNDDGYPASLIFSEELVVGAGAVSLQYTYDEEIFENVLTKYYQTQELDSEGIPVVINAVRNRRYYLDENDRIIAEGRISGNNVSDIGLYTYDDKGNQIEVKGTYASFRYTYGSEKGITFGAAAPKWVWNILGCHDASFMNPSNLLIFETAILQASYKKDSWHDYSGYDNGYPKGVTRYNELSGQKQHLTFTYIEAK